MTTSAKCQVPGARRRLGFAKAVALTMAVALAAAFTGGCGGDDDIEIIPPPGTGTALPATTATPEPAAEPTELRVAYLNLMSPVTLDRTNTVAADTFDTRLAMVVEELKLFKPDLVAFSEVTDTKEHGRVASVLAKELKMEPLYVRAKPWYVGSSQEANDAIVKSTGLEEGGLILVNGSRFPNPEGERKWLNPRTSEAEVAAGLWMRLKGPASIGTIDVFVSQLTGTDTRVRAQQAADFAQFIKAKRGPGPAIVLGDIGDAVGTPTHQVFLDLGLVDLFAGTEVTTCCRDSVVGEPAPPELRTDFMFSSGWKPAELGLFVDQPKKQDDGTLVFASDHNGIRAVFPILGASGP